MKTGLVQYSPLWENKEGNKEKIALMMSNAEKTDLLIFPEMTLTGFTMKPSRFAEDMDGGSICFFKTIAADYRTNVIAGVIEAEDKKFFNTLVHVNKEGELVSKYRKIHPFSYSDEDKNYSRGEKTVVTGIDGWKAGLSICYDLRFPELFRYYAVERVSLIINIASWPDTRIEHWKALLKARAIENQCYMVGVNRVGEDPGLTYSGYSSIYDPMGEEVLSVVSEEKIITTDLPLNKTEEVRTRLPFLNDICLLK
jgi:predicted amidohydrolase